MTEYHIVYYLFDHAQMSVFKNISLKNCFVSKFFSKNNVNKINT